MVEDEVIIRLIDLRLLEEDLDIREEVDPNHRKILETVVKITNDLEPVLEPGLELGPESDIIIIKRKVPKEVGRSSKRIRKIQPLEAELAVQSADHPAVIDPSHRYLIQMILHIHHQSELKREKLL